METTTAQRPKRVTSPRYRRFCFTLNNWTEDELTLLKALPCTWMIVGKEVGAEGTPHLQGAVCLSTQRTLAGIKKLPGFARAHIEEMKGTPEDSLVYCSKEDPNPFQKGDMPRPGKRNDLQEVAAKVLEGVTLQELAETDPAMIIKYHSGLTVLRSYQTKPRRPSDPPTVIWIHGRTGTGKTRASFEACERMFGEGTCWMSCGSLRWFPKYDGHPGVVLDDIRTKHCEFGFLLRLLDRYPFQVEPKGSHAEWIPKLIFITAPQGPREMWNLRTEEQLDQLERRITHIITAPEELWRVHEMLWGEDGTLVVPTVQAPNGGGMELSQSEQQQQQQQQPILISESDSELSWNEEEALGSKQFYEKYGYCTINKQS